ncbi:(d)CMP kinase [Gilvibacter sediminis]|uniref:(d)CMP kinase n=1 Tax=Gilvibacter sediminis TaxID=379071 RepID=UPI0023501D32|nr:(d)CMP kinase [Gilvibacter sediminis]MDC7997764.1 (d)CMP kinase [Gilvibacter sediminis]
MRKITIAIDGYSSTGKSTVAKQLADYLGYIYVDTGAMYRSITLYALNEGIIKGEDLNKEALIAALPQIEVAFSYDSDSGTSQVLLNGERVGSTIRTLEVSEHVSPVAAIPEVRKKLVAIQHQMGKEGGIVMDGRDIGTVVFPNAELKIFMTADAAERAKRRYLELKNRGDNITYDEVYENVTERDRIDTTRADSPLVKAADAIEIDNTETNLEDQFHTILQLVKDRIAGRV